MIAKAVMVGRQGGGVQCQLHNFLPSCRRRHSSRHDKSRSIVSSSERPVQASLENNGSKPSLIVLICVIRRLSRHHGHLTDWELHRSIRLPSFFPPS